MINLLNEPTGTVHAVKSIQIGGGITYIKGKIYYITKCHWTHAWNKKKWQLGKEVARPVTCKNCLKAMNQNGRKRLLKLLPKR